MNISPLSALQLGSQNTANNTATQTQEAARQLRQAAISQGPAGTQAVDPAQAVAASQSGQAVQDKNTLSDAINKTNDFVHEFNDSVEFSLHEETGQFVVKVVDKQTKEVIRQMPSEEAIHIAETLDQLKGLLLYNKA